MTISHHDKLCIQVLTKELINDDLCASKAMSMSRYDKLYVQITTYIRLKVMAISHHNKLCV